MAKIIAEYGRAIEEMFVYLYALSEQAKEPEHDVFYDKLVYYKTRELNMFVDSEDFEDLYTLLELKRSKELSISLKLNEDELKEQMGRISSDIKTIKGERQGDLQDLYNKLKHPFLVYSQVPSNLKKGLCFGIVESHKVKKDERETLFNLRPIKVSLSDAKMYLQETRLIGFILEFVIKCFLISYEPWKKRS